MLEFVDTQSLRIAYLTSGTPDVSVPSVLVDIILYN